jgi:Tol biopolymer transport system component
MLLGGAILAAGAGAAGALQFAGWGPAMNAESLPRSSKQLNTAFNDGCPILDPATNNLYMASNRPGGQGGLDIWIAPWTLNGWGTPVNAGPGINTAADEFCPDPVTGNRLFFVRRLSPTNTDIYMTTRIAGLYYTVPQRLPASINSAAEEWSPSYVQAGGHQYLFFSSTREGRQRIYYSVNFGPAQLAPGDVNSAYADARPNVRFDGLEMVWDSTRPGTFGGPDIWTSQRSSLNDPWGPAVHLGSGINSPANETRASMSGDGKRLMFGTTRPGEGSADIWTATR